MNGTTPQYDHPEIWRPLTGMPEGAHAWRVPGYRELSDEWASIRAALKDRDEPRAFLDKWLEERGRAFAIETGQIEGLYTLKYGITEQLIAEGLSGVVGAHTVENVQDRTIQGLLADQETAYNMLFADIAGGRPLSQHTIKTWHQLITRHQETVAGIAPDGRRVRCRSASRGSGRCGPTIRDDGMAWCTNTARRSGCRTRWTASARCTRTSRGRAIPSRPKPPGCTIGSCAPIPSRTATAGSRAC